MEGFGDEVIIFGLGTLVSGCLLLRMLVWNGHGNSGRTENTTTEELNGRTRTGEIDCCICLGETQLAVETNCGHIYCGNCILEVWRRTASLSPMPCPYCRQRITILLPYFSSDERNTAEPTEIETRNSVLSQLTTYNRRFSGEPRSLMEQLLDLPVLLRHLWSYLWSGQGLHFAFQLRVVLLGIMWLIYLLSPLDLLPEAVFGIIGLLDDLFIFILISMHLAYFFRQILSNMFDADIPGVNQ